MDAGPGPAGSVLAASLEVDGQTLIAMNGGLMFKFTPATLLFIHCRTQAEIDHYWSKFLSGGQAQQCGLLTDKFGVNWHVVPTMLGQMLRDPDAKCAARVMKVMLTMVTQVRHQNQRRACFDDPSSMASKTWLWG